jgi:hypothetical protein
MPAGKPAREVDGDVGGDVDGHRAAIGQFGDGGGQAVVGQHRRVDAPDQFAQVHHQVLRLPVGVGQRDAGGRARIGVELRDPQLHGHAEQPLLGAVVQVPLDAPALRLERADQAGPRLRDLHQLRCRRVVLGDQQCPHQRPVRGRDSRPCVGHQGQQEHGDGCERQRVRYGPHLPPQELRGGAVREYGQQQGHRLEHRQRTEQRSGDGGRHGQRHREAPLPPGERIRPPLAQAPRRGRPERPAVDEGQPSPFHPRDGRREQQHEHRHQARRCERAGDDQPDRPALDTRSDGHAKRGSNAASSGKAATAATTLLVATCSSARHGHAVSRNRGVASAPAAVGRSSGMASTVVIARAPVGEARSTPRGRARSTTPDAPHRGRRCAGPHATRPPCPHCRRIGRVVADPVRESPAHVPPVGGAPKEQVLPGISQAPGPRG